MPDLPDAEPRTADVDALIAAEAKAADEAEPFSDPDEPLPPHVRVIRGLADREHMEKGMEELS